MTIEQLIHDKVVARQGRWEDLKASFLKELEQLLWDQQVEKWNEELRKKHGQ